MFSKLYKKRFYQLLKEFVCFSTLNITKVFVTIHSENSWIVCMQVVPVIKFLDVINIFGRFPVVRINESLL